MPQLRLCNTQPLERRFATLCPGVLVLVVRPEAAVSSRTSLSLHSHPVIPKEREELISLPLFPEARTAPSMGGGGGEQVQAWCRANEFLFLCCISPLQGPCHCWFPAWGLLAVLSAALMWTHPREERQVRDDGYPSKSPICVSQHPFLSCDGGCRHEINQHGRIIEWFRLEGTFKII